MADAVYETRPGPSLRATGSRSRAVRSFHVVGHQPYARAEAIFDEMLTTNIPEGTTAPDPSQVSGGELAIWKAHPDDPSIWVQGYRLKRRFNKTESEVEVLYGQEPNDWGAANPQNVGTRWSITRAEVNTPLYKQVQVQGQNFSTVEWRPSPMPRSRGAVHYQEITVLRPSGFSDINPLVDEPADYLAQIVVGLAGQIDRLFMEKDDADKPVAQRFPWLFTGATIYPDGLWRWTAVYYFSSLSSMKALEVGADKDLPANYLPVPRVPVLGQIWDSVDENNATLPPKYEVMGPLDLYDIGQPNALPNTRFVAYHEQEPPAP